MGDYMKFIVGTKLDEELLSPEKISYEYNVDQLNFLERIDPTSEKSNKYWSNWPILYILRQAQCVDASKKKIAKKRAHKPFAYIGQTTGGLRRMEEHRKSEDKQMFTMVNFIYSKEFNQSVTFDYESKLIQLFSAEGTYALTNGNSGLQDKDYYNKEYYDQGFYALWTRLLDDKIVSKTMNEIRNSDFYKYSPYKSLNAYQELAANAILSAIEAQTKEPIVINGMPGSGKTIIAIYMFKLLRDRCVENHDMTTKMALVIPQVSLRTTLKKLFKRIYNLSPSDVIGPSELVKNHYDIVFVDEAHRLRQRKNIVNHKAHKNNNEVLHLDENATELDWVLATVDTPVLFFDADQTIGPSGLGESNFYETLESRCHRPLQRFELKTQMRVRAGDTYLTYIKEILDGKATHKKEVQNYEFKLVEAYSTFNELLNIKERDTGLARMLAGFAWKWISKKDKQQVDIIIDGIGRQWNTTPTDWVNSESSINEIGSIHCIQGYDLNYGFVILGPDIKYDVEKKSIYADKNKYFDVNGKKSATPEELTQYIKNIYYVLMTRGIKGTYLYVCDDDLKTYLKKYVDVI